MAIDTENKRRSVLAYTPGAYCAPLADASVDNEDRYAVAWIYAGTTPQGAPTETILDYERGFGRGMYRGFAVGMN